MLTLLQLYRIAPFSLAAAWHCSVGDLLGHDRSSCFATASAAQVVLDGDLLRSASGLESFRVSESTASELSQDGRAVQIGSKVSTHFFWS